MIVFTPAGRFVPANKLSNFKDLKEAIANETESIDSWRDGDFPDQCVRLTVSSHGESSRCPTHCRSRGVYDGGANPGSDPHQYTDSSYGDGDPNISAHVDTHFYFRVFAWHSNRSVCNQY